MPYDSLVISNTIELMGGGHVVNTTVAPGAVFAMQPGLRPRCPTADLSHHR